MTRSRVPRIGITLGDAAGIGSEVVLKALRHRRLVRPLSVVLYGSRLLLEETARRLHLPCPLGRPRSGLDLRMVDCFTVPIESFAFGAVSTTLADGAMRCVTAAVAEALERRLDAVVTAPINKTGIQRAGYPYAGHTDFLAHLCRADDYGMMFVGAGLRVILVTIHVSLAEAVRRITAERVHRSIRLMAASLRRLFGVRRPRIAVCGINPHAGENGLLGTEDVEVTKPGVERACADGIAAQGPFPSDTVFLQARAGAFDGVVAMYHDQGLIPVKLLAFNEAVNLTVGLPFVRTSPDHGTAYDIAGRGVADPGSMLAAIGLAAALALRARRSR